MASEIQGRGLAGGEVLVFLVLPLGRHQDFPPGDLLFWPLVLALLCLSNCPLLHGFCMLPISIIRKKGLVPEFFPERNEMSSTRYFRRHRLSP